ncbi:hypothetical protein AB4Z17_28995 [Paenibacillus sp. TAF43_2]|uniref:hypothetical protein n=1 Tax=Paenibacillus sp. TAF43_2 TaxID=3233069 RepID=UPI003F993E49
MAKENKNDVVIIKLDRPREMRFGHKALKKMQAMTGLTMEQVVDGDIGYEQFEAIIYCGVLEDSKDDPEPLTIEKMEDLLDSVSPKYYMKKITEAIIVSFTENEEGNEQPQGKTNQ